MTQEKVLAQLKGMFKIETIDALGSPAWISWAEWTKLRERLHFLEETEIHEHLKELGVSVKMTLADYVQQLSAQYPAANVRSDDSTNLVFITLPLDTYPTLVNFDITEAHVVKFGGVSENKLTLVIDLDLPEV